MHKAEEQQVHNKKKRCFIECLVTEIWWLSTTYNYSWQHQSSTSWPVWELISPQTVQSATCAVHNPTRPWVGNPRVVQLSSCRPYQSTEENFNYTNNNIITHENCNHRPAMCTEVTEVDRHYRISVTITSMFHDIFQLPVYSQMSCAKQNILIRFKQNVILAAVSCVLYQLCIVPWANDAYRNWLK